ncbi:hypothetical protein [Cupriavidus basilensis]|uniref:hypothetical protein n=1 Tax=Cupriavidus basilensis TaxID=68895 RepID=UPI00157ACA29|nr:hypothetical protein [Cupriavidus basilensis]NUA27308.1 hypothetical protein [Cupriavidus basilensis]
MTHPVPKQWLWLDTALSRIALPGILTCLGLIDFHGMRSLDVGGTLFGGSFNQMMYAGSLILLFIVIPLANALRAPLPHCAFSKAGSQLSVCLDAGDAPVIVD